MDDSRFDTLTRTFAVSRRKALGIAIGGALAGVTSLLGQGTSEAARRGFPGPPNPFLPRGCTVDGAACGSTAGRICCNRTCCPPNRCCSDTGQCTVCPDRCEIDGQDYPAGAVDPSGGCGVCEPTQNHFDWTTAPDGVICGGVAGRVCCNGECCSPTECCAGIGVCTECGPHCLIGGVEIEAGAVNLANECEVCDPARAIESWSPLDDGRACNNGDGCCVQGACGTCSCLIDNDRVLNGEHNNRNDCEFCSYNANPTDWTNRPNGASCGTNRDCCDGECCPEGECCTLDGCELCCHIGSDTVADGVVNPRQTCQVCDANRDFSDWTTLRNGEACGATGNSECCNGECCPAGECCRNGACGLCDCEIGTKRFAPDTINDDNPCEICKPELNRFGWSPVSSGVACDGGTCCGGECCASDLCCLLDACGDCLCSIDNEIFDPQEHNDDNDCELCDPHANPFGWTKRQNNEICEGNRHCCNGLCCDEGLCCIDGACSPCGCLIGDEVIAPGTFEPGNDCRVCDPDRAIDAWSPLDEGADCGDSPAQCCASGICEICRCLIDDIPVADGEPNPLNECEQCDLALDPSGWTRRNETFACGDGTQICCNGVCCPTGNCCNLDDICEPCRCEIEGTTVEAQEFAPNNLCLFCDPASSTTSWTFGPDYSVCSDPTAEINRYCCQGVCCQEHECCRSDGACGPCTCIIEGVGEFDEGDRNPANDCEFCNPSDNMTGWSVLAEGDICGPNLDQTCCSGQCGCPTGCLIDGVSYPDGTIHFRCDICDAATNPNDWTPRAIPDCPTPCLIGGVIIRSGTTNPDNPCQICSGGEDWSPSNELFCGDGSQVCCHGACCESGACCGEDGLCGFDACELQGCVIDGVQFEDGTTNPNNACQVCNTGQSTTSWTAQFGACGPTGERFCCAGVCCELGACCSLEDVCAFDACETCAIDGQLWFPEDRNPANGCEMCIANANKFAWTPLPDFFWCDEMQLTTCCAGRCCEAGTHCDDGACVPD